MGIERTIRVGCIKVPPLPDTVGHNIHHAAHGIGTELNRHHTAIDFNPLGKIHRDIVKAERCADTLLRYTVNENLYVLTTEAVEHKVNARTLAARLAQPDTRRF